MPGPATHEKPVELPKLAADGTNFLLNAGVAAAEGRDADFRPNSGSEDARSAVSFKKHAVGRIEWFFIYDPEGHGFF
jgi:hypothetical protein